VTAFKAVVLENFRRPRNCGSLPGANGEAEGANPLCGDRIRVQILAAGETIADARFTADACAICIAAASLLTEGARGMRVSDARSLDLSWLHTLLEGEPPPGRKRCVALPLETFHRAIDTIASQGAGA
jgi:nitrogen fixation NifU-like protein